MNIPLSFLFIPYAAIILIFIVFYFFHLYHIFRYSFWNTLGFITIFFYTLAAIYIISASLFAVSSINWNTTFPFFSDFGEIPNF